MLWKCKGRDESGEVGRKSPQNLTLRCGRKREDKDGFSFSSVGSLERVGPIKRRKWGSQGVAVLLCPDTPAGRGRLPLPPPPFHCQKQKRPPPTPPPFFFPQKLYLSHLKVLCGLKGVLDVTMRK